MSGNSAARPNVAVNGASGARGASAVNGEVNGIVAAGGRAGGIKRANLAVPKAVIEEGIRVTRECLELVCEIDE